MKKELLRTGIWNKTVKVTLDRLKDLAKNFNNSTGKSTEGFRVPLFIGHPDDPSTAPASGWLAKVWVEGKSLFGEFADITEKATKEIKEKIFRDVSVGMQGNNLVHVALTNDPAVSNLGDFFKQKDSELITLSQIKDEGEMDEAKFLDKFKTFFKKEIISDHLNHEEDMADKELLAKVEKLEAKFSKQAEDSKAVVTERDELKKSNTDITANLSKAEEKIKELETSAENAEVEALDKADESFCDGLITEGKMKPANKEFNLFQMKNLRGAEKTELTIGGKKVSVSPVEHLKENLSKAPKFSELEDLDPGENESKDDTLTQLANKKMEADKSLTFSQAGNLVLQERPELDKEEK